MTKNYLDIQVEKALKQIKDHNRKTNSFKVYVCVLI